MPTMETDLIFAFLNPNDKYHKAASILFSEINQGKKINLPTSVLIEIELIYKSENRVKELKSRIAHLTIIPNLNVVPLTPEMVLLAIELQEEYQLSFFDSHHVATALMDDGILIGTDVSFEDIEGLTMEYLK
ncbi:MAG: hypothetical protein HeimC3_14640 [Candidatus Heimdallarchaeota archaeon LC_3]|nr:MAG: hypothetical protein HeimC3_14640 [Candidatus Heimdallarchaeota archaeon LC_3]